MTRSMRPCFFGMLSGFLFTIATAHGQSSLPTTRPLDLVETRQGSDAGTKISRGSTLPLVSTPWALTDWSVQTSGNILESRFFDPASNHFAGIRATHQPSPWVGDHAQMLILPQTGDAVADWKNRVTTCDAKSAVFRPEYLKVNLPESRVQLEMTATARCAIFRFTFDPKDKTGRILLDPAGPAGMAFTANGFAASAGHHGLPAPRDFKMYFVGQLDRPITKSVGLAPLSPKAKDGESPAGYFEFDISTNPVVELKVGTSFISNEQAEQNLNAETAAGFEATRAATAAAWDAQLNRVEVTGTDDQQKTFYSCLYRAMKFPHRLDEITADHKRIHYSPWDGKIHDGPAYTDNGLWDTYRTQFPLLSIAWQDQMGDMCAGWINAYREAGWLPSWPSPGGIDGMPGTHADVLIADAMTKGIKGFDYDEAYKAVHKDSFEQGGFGAGRGKLNVLIEKGFLPQGPGVSSVSDTLDYCYDDWAVAQVARITNHPDEAATLEARSRNYANVWDPSVGFMRSRDADGHWSKGDFDEFAWGGAYVEGGPWQCSWAVPFDMAGLAKLAGGNDAMAAKLDRLFELPPTFHPGAYGYTIHEMAEMPGCNMGQCSMNNQPSFHIPYMYAAIGRPWHTEYWTRRACRTIFNSSPQGFPGDEDTGSMAAWYVLSSIGLYQMTPGYPQYVLTSPVFTKVVIHLPAEKTFTINAPGNDNDSVYVQSRKLNGTEYSHTWISHADLTAGGTMDVVTGPAPVTKVLTGVDLPYSLSTARK